MSEWSDDSDSDSDSELDLESDDSQYTSVSSDSPFYAAHPPVAFQTTFDVPLVPFPSKPLLDVNYSEASVAQSRAEFERVKKDLFLVDEGCLRNMADELFLRHRRVHGCLLIPPAIHYIPSLPQQFQQVWWRLRALPEILSGAVPRCTPQRRRPPRPPLSQ
ncbi:hypothetical protein B0H14DRAFT_31307 [Mycena olivaceomarginata]|nr:hypothetical protein B0H14DRAFT_31307 [Mycena olivaceomarginata]